MDFKVPSEWDYKNVYCFILAGGKSTRLGFDKASARIGDESLIELVIRKISPLFENIAVITRKDSQIPDMGYKVLYDLMPGSGSLGGIYTGLVRSPSYFNFFFSCDMPFIEPEFIKSMLDEPKNYDILLPRSGKNFEPLHAIYAKGCLPVVRQLLASGVLRIIDLFSKVNVKYIEESQWKKFDKNGKMFHNINTPDDLKLAQEQCLRK